MNSNITYPGMEDFIIKKSEEQNGVFHLHVEMERGDHQCPRCNSLTNKVHDYRIQKIQHIKIFARDTFVYYKKRRYVCSNNECSKRFYESNAFIEKFQRQSKELRKAIAFDVIHAKNFKDVAFRFNTSITTVVRRFDQITSSMLSKRKPLPKVIAIDEYKGDAGGERFQTIIVDPVNRIPLDILPDRRKETVKEYLRTYGQNVSVVVMDMSPSFKAAVDQALGKPVVVADRFHFYRYIYWALERVRRKEQNHFHEYDRKKYKRMRHIFYRRKDELTDKQQWYLERYLNMSDYLRQAYELEESYCSWFDEAKLLTKVKDIVSIKKKLYTFYEEVKESGVDEFIKAIQTFKNWQLEILNSFAYDLHNGFIEGLNNQTKVIKRNAFGFKRFDRLRLKVLLHHQYKDIAFRVS